MSFPRSNYTGFPFDAESARDEFPFDRSGSRDNHFQSTLDDLAKRHPELAGHFQNINQRPRSRSRPSEDFKAQFRRPFGEHFPFDDDFDIDPQEYVKQFYNEPEKFYNTETNFPQASSYQQETPRQKENSSYTQQPEAQAAQPEQTFVPPKEEAAAQQPEPEKTGIQQSSTVDLGQKQEPIDDRNQRSMSAPPGGETKKRYTSSINIPVNTPPQNMSQNQQQSDVKSNERIIPIQIEGRDDPVIPKNTHIPQTHSQSHTMPGVFGPRQDHFQRQFPDDYFYRANIPHNFHQQKQDIPIPVQKETPAEQKQHQPQQQQPPPQQQHQQPPQPQQPQEPVPEPKVAPPERKPRTPIEQIQEIQKDVSSLMEQVEHFTGQSKDKQYLFLDEMLTRNLIKLDNIDTQGQETIRQARKEAIKCIQQAIALLESKATGDSAEKMEVDEKQESLTEDNKPETNSEEVRSKEANSEAGSSSEAQKTNVPEDSTTQEQNKSTEPVNTETSGEAINQENRAVLVEPVLQANDAEAASENIEDKTQVDCVDSKDKKKEKKVKKGKKDCSPH